MRFQEELRSSIHLKIEKDDDGTVVAYPALRQTCNPPGFGFCSLFGRSGTNERTNKRTNKQTNKQTNDKQGKIELLSQWTMEGEDGQKVWDGSGTGIPSDPVPGTKTKKLR